MSNELGNPYPGSPDVMIKQGSTPEEIEKSIRVIENLIHAMNAASFPLLFYHQAMEGAQLLRAIHASLLKELGPERIEQIKKRESFKSQTPNMTSPGAA